MVSTVVTIFLTFLFYFLLDYDLSRKKQGKRSYLIDWLPFINGKLTLPPNKLEPSTSKLWKTFFFNITFGMIFIFGLFPGISYLAPWWFYRIPE
jgi:hypothetical protein